IDTNYPPRMHSEMMKGYNRADERAKAVVAEVRAIASEVGWSPAQVALAWLRQRPMSVIPIVGARRLEQFKDNLACLDLTLDGLQVKRLDSASHVESGFPHDLYERDLVKGSSMARCETRSTCDPNRAAGTDVQHVPLHEQDIEEASSLFDVNIKGGVLPHVHEVRDRADAQDRRRGDREHVVDLRAQRLPWLVAVHGHEARRHRHDQGGGAGRRRAGHPGGCGRLRPGGDAPAGEGDRRRPSWLRRLRSDPRRRRPSTESLDIRLVPREAMENTPMSIDNRKPTILVLGVTGQTGRLIVAELDHDPGGVQVRLAARRPEQVERLKAEGRDAVLLDLDDPRTFGQTLAGVDRLF